MAHAVSIAPRHEDCNVDCHVDDDRLMRARLGILLDGPGRRLRDVGALRSAELWRVRRHVPARARHALGDLCECDLQPRLRSGLRALPGRPVQPRRRVPAARLRDLHRQPVLRRHHHHARQLHRSPLADAAAAEPELPPDVPVVWSAAGARGHPVQRRPSLGRRERRGGDAQPECDRHVRF